MNIKYINQVETHLEVGVKLVHEGDAGGEVAAHDGLVAHVVQVLDDAAEGVTVRRHQDALAGLQLRHDDLVPVGQRPLNGQLQRLAAGELGLARPVLVAGIVP